MKDDRREQIFHGITNIDEDILEEVLDTESGNKRKYWRRWVAVAACLCFAGTVAGGIWFGVYHGNPRGRGEEIMNQKREIARADKKDTGEDRENVTPSPTEKGNENQRAKKRSGIRIAPVELPKDSDSTQSSATYDMMGLLVYKGKVYTQAEFYEGDEMERVSSAVGEKLGRAKGTLNEWSSQEDYAKQFASTYSGDIHRVKGYDEDFRLCCIEKFQEDGVETKFIVFLECLNGIDLIWGRDLYEKRLHMKGHIQKVQYQKHQDWNEGVKKYDDLEGFSDVSLDEFIDELYKGGFEDVSQTEPEFYKELKDIDGDGGKWKQVHLKFLMQDGTMMKLWIFENGYVTYEGLRGPYFLKVSKKALGPIVSQCD